jgi:exosortase A-associated hydrolase 2
VTRRLPHVEYVAARSGRLLAVVRGLSATNRHAVLVVPPFAEEMNKSRRMISEVALALAEQGTASVCFDLHGTGDSEGEFVAATWDEWLDNIATMLAWSRAQGIDIDRLLAVRLGCLLAAAFLAAGPAGVRKCVFWHPVLEGRRYLDEFLRLKLAAGLFDDSRKSSVASLRVELQTSGSLEVAGYALPAKLVAAIDALTLGELLPKANTAVDWIEITRSADAPVPLPVAQLMERLLAAGTPVEHLRIPSDPFWTSTEIVVSASVTAATVQALRAAV